jgi:hypothetical protein
MTRGLQDARTRLEAFGKTDAGFWLSFISTGVLGVSLLLIWPVIGLPWWIGLAFFAALFASVLSEGAYRTWRDLESRLRRGGIVLGGGVSSILTSPIPGARADRVSFNRMNQEARVVQRAGDQRMPVAIEFERPRAKRIYHAHELPQTISGRDGLRRHTVTEFVPGGFVIDDRDAPPLSELVCKVFYEEELPPVMPAFITELR